MPQPLPPAAEADAPLAEMRALVARGRQLFLVTIAGQEAEAERLEQEVRIDRRHAAASTKGSNERRLHLAAAETHERDARAARARAAANQATMVRVDAVLAGEDA